MLSRCLQASTHPTPWPMYCMAKGEGIRTSPILSPHRLILFLASNGNTFWLLSFSYFFFSNVDPFFSHIYNFCRKEILMELKQGQGRKVPPPPFFFLPCSAGRMALPITVPACQKRKKMHSGPSTKWPPSERGRERKRESVWASVWDVVVGA